MKIKHTGPREFDRSAVADAMTAANKAIEVAADTRAAIDEAMQAKERPELIR